MARTLLLILGLCWMQLAQADVGQVERYFKGLESLSADFVQTIYDEHGKTIEQASGRMYMERPRRFRWDYQRPYRQLVVADGTRVWLYDESLQQITVEPLDKALGATPLALLSGSKALSKVFTIQPLQAQGQLSWYELRPHQPQQQLQFLRLGFFDNQLRVLEMDDALQRRTRIALDHVERNPKLDAALFHFTPPPGVDVVGAAQ